MRLWIGRVLIGAGAAGTVYALYLLAGRDWALLVGSVIVYVVGYNLLVTHRAPVVGEARSDGSASLEGYRRSSATKRGLN
jgi:hypothetical protein